MRTSRSDQGKQRPPGPAGSWPAALPGTPACRRQCIITPKIRQLDQEGQRVVMEEASCQGLTPTNRSRCPRSSRSCCIAIRGSLFHLAATSITGATIGGQCTERPRWNAAMYPVAMPTQATSRRCISLPRGTAKTRERSTPVRPHRTRGARRNLGRGRVSAWKT